MQEPKLDEIIAARNECAKIIAAHGEQYLSIFERLEQEIELSYKLSYNQESDFLLNRIMCFISISYACTNFARNLTPCTNSLYSPHLGE